MKQGIFHRPVAGGGIAAILLALAFGLYLVFGGQSNPLDGAIEPLDDYTKERYRASGLEFIAETGRIVTHPNGNREIIWDAPQLPTLEEWMRMNAEAAEKGDTAPILYCTDELSEYLKAQSELSGESVTQSDSIRFPTCQAIPDRIVLGPNRTGEQRP